MIGVTLLAVPCAYVGWQAKTIASRRTELERILANGGAVFIPTNRNVLPNTRPDIPIMRRWLGDQSVRSIGLPQSWSADDIWLVRKMFPEASVVTLVDDTAHP